MSKARSLFRTRSTALVAALAIILFGFFLMTQLAAQGGTPDVAKAVKFRWIGPSAQGGRFIDVAVPELEPTTIYMAAATGGLWKSVNNGNTWESIFDDQAVVSLGDVAVAPSDPKILYVGTGEHTSSRSTYWGDGVYKSTDAGKTWTNVGLKDTQHIGRVLIDAKDPNIVYVAALGHLYSDNEERGVYKTIDGGKTWTKSLEVKADGRNVGACDLVMDPKNPKILYAAAYDKERRPWTFNLAGPGSGIYKTIDAGKTWTKLAGGLPAGMLGRIGLTIYPKNPLILYANIENGNKPGMSDADRLKELRAGMSSNGMTGEEVYRTDDGGKTWKKVNETVGGRGATGEPDAQTAPGEAPSAQNPPAQAQPPQVAPAGRGARNTVGGGPGYYYMQIRVDPNDASHLYVLTVGVLESKDGGKSWTTPFRFGGDNHALWIDPANSKHMILGFDHGFGITWDGGANWARPDHLPLAQLYAIGIDNQVPYNVYGGIQDNGSIRGPSSKRGGRPIVYEDWQGAGGGDGQYNVVDMVTNRYLYNSSQNASFQRTDLYTGERKNIVPPDQTLRFGWTSPILISPFDANTIYVGGNKVMKSTNRGDTWTEISLDLSTNDKTKLTTGKGGDGNIEYCTIETLDESPIVRDLLYAGTDDGNVWVTKDAKNWTKLNDKIKDSPRYWVSRVIASRHMPGRAYVTFTGLRNDDFRAFIYKTEDYGDTWTSIAGNLPSRSINVIREDPKNPNLLFIGVDFGVFYSMDLGKTWTEMKGLGMPTQPVHDLLIHPRENDLIIGTHGRGFYIADISVLEEMSDQVMAQDAYLFDMKPRVKWVTRLEREAATINYSGPSEPNGVVINYYLKSAAQGDVTVQVMQGGRVLSETKGTNNAGFNQVLWNMRWTPMTLVEAPAGRGGRGGGGGFGGGRGAQPGAMPSFGGNLAADPGEYTIVVKVGARTLMKKVRILEDVWFDKTF